MEVMTERKSHESGFRVVGQSSITDTSACSGSIFSFGPGSLSMMMLLWFRSGGDDGTQKSRVRVQGRGSIEYHRYFRLLRLNFFFRSGVAQYDDVALVRCDFPPWGPTIQTRTIRFTDKVHQELARLHLYPDDQKSFVSGFFAASDLQYSVNCVHTIVPNPGFHVRKR